MAQKFKTWAESYRENPSEKVWNSIDQRLNEKAHVPKHRMIVLNLMKIAAIFIFVYGFFTLWQRTENNSSFSAVANADFTLEPLDLNEISVYCNPQYLSDLKNAYRKKQLGN